MYKLAFTILVLWSGFVVAAVPEVPLSEVPLSEVPLSEVPLSEVPLRVMSVNQCTDQLLAYLAPRQLISVTWLSHEPLNIGALKTLREKSANHGYVEEVLRLQPGLVVGGEYGTPMLQSQLTQLHIPFLAVPLAQDLEEVTSNWRMLGQRLNREARATEIISDLNAGLTEAAETVAFARGDHGAPIRALIVNPNNWLAGRANLQHAFLTRLGFLNLAAENGIVGWQQVSLEALLQWNPDLIIMPGLDGSRYARSHQLLRHPAWAKLKPHFGMLHLPLEQLGCGLPDMVQLARQLANHVRTRHVSGSFDSGATP